MRKHNVSYNGSEMHIQNKNGSDYSSLKYYDIITIITDTPYVTILAKGYEKKIYINYSLSKIIEELPSVFFLCNQSTIINLYYLRLYEEKYSQYTLHLKNGQNFKVSRRRRNAFKDRLLHLKSNCSLDCEQKSLCNKICLAKEKTAQ